MNHSKIVGAIVVVVLLVAASYYYFRGKGYVIELTESEIQQKLSDRFPVNKCVLIMCLSLSDPVVKLEDGTDRIRFAAQAALNIKLNDKQLHGLGEFAGRIRYARQQGEFYLDDAEVILLRIDGIPEPYSQKAHELAKAAVNEYLKIRPIYRLKPTEAKHVLARLVLKDVRVAKRVLIVTLGLAS
ncbi:MAG: DUF1439 domain-containing protein [Deltaproteobacteria bacterium]|nr:DUF1439 domain-containing protein [Deltaproteobacteria bacterium]